jgi:hypothetical protein
MWDETRAEKGQSVSALGLTARDRVRLPKLVEVS